MAKARTIVGKLRDDEVLRIARARISESAAATYTQVSIDTQLSVERGIIWMINFIEFAYPAISHLQAVAANGIETIQAQVTRESKTTMVAGNDSDLIQRHILEYFRSPAIGTDAGPIVGLVSNPFRYDFPVPIPYASQSIYAALLATSAGTTNCDVRIGYTIREVDDQFFFRVAQALLG